jgi:organic radical activating enzyme
VTVTYLVKEIFYTLQGEGTHAGRPAVFCRFSRCNLWTGREKDRARAICTFCDTDFVGTDGVGGGRFATADDLAAAVDSSWPASEPGRGSTTIPKSDSNADPTSSQGRQRHGTQGHSAQRKFVVCTGGEPLLQLDDPAVQALHQRGFEVAVETNGTRTPPPGIDWLCVSPKIGADLVVSSGDELKLVYPQAGGDPAQFADLDFTSFRLQPMDGPDVQAHTRAAIDYCLTHPQWSLSMQTHKYLGIA